MSNALHRDQLTTAYELLLECRGVCPHLDADGLAAGAIALRARHDNASGALLLRRGQTPFTPGLLPPQRPLAILDWGVRPFEGSALFVDHHFPEASPAADQVVVSGYGEVPEISTAVLMGRIVPATPRWLVAVGAVGDLGDRAWDLPDTDGAIKSHVRKLVPLLNAPRRLPSGPVRTALAILTDAPDERAALMDERIEVLQEAANTWRVGYRSALRVAPEVDGGVAVIRFSSPFQVHPLVAQAWARRLAPSVVIAANHDYLPGMVNFAIRGGQGDLRETLRRALPNQTGEFAHGHARATGGSLPPPTFEKLIRALRAR